MKFLQGFRDQMVELARGFSNGSSAKGMFINSCFAHCQSEMPYTWNSNAAGGSRDTKQGDCEISWGLVLRSSSSEGHRRLLLPLRQNMPPHHMTRDLVECGAFCS